MRIPALLVASVAVILVTGAGCGTGEGSATASGPAAASAPADPAGSAAATSLEGRLNAVDEAITRWQSATDLATLGAAAEEARNLIVGPAGPGYGDADGDGTVGGASDAGLLPGLDGQPGLATEADGSCVARDVLGGSWSDPAVRWATLDEAIKAWGPSNNTFPALPSHPQRIVGWSTLALDTSNLATALEYGGHARLHIDISMNAVTDCR